jgi:head-tail adaptor
MIHLLNSTVSIERATITIGDDGSPQAQWQTHLAAIKARVQARPSRRTHDERPTERRRMRVYVESHHDIQLTDRIVYDGRTFNIDDVRAGDALQAIDTQEVHT